MELSLQNQKLLLQAQEIEKTEYYIFLKLAKLSSKNKEVLNKIADDSLKHMEYWENVTKKKVVENRFKICFFVTIARLFGLTFAIKAMEKEEKNIEKFYQKVIKIDKKFEWIINEEKIHETEILKLLDDELLKYVGSIVLGLSDALVELTGTLAGLSLTLQNNKLIGTTGLITGLAASLSMASSEYLSIKSGGEEKNALKASIYTGITYVTTTLALICPYFIFNNYWTSLGVTLIIGAIITTVSSFYISVTKEISFKRRLSEGLILSFGVALTSFVVGIIVRQFLHLDI